MRRSRPKPGQKERIIMKKAKVSKYMQVLAKRFNLDVKAFYSDDGYGRHHIVYQFYGNFLANFESLEREAKGYTKSNEYDAALERI